MEDDTARSYRVIQKGRYINEPVTDFDSLVTHHPANNARIRMEDSSIVGAENPVKRSHAFIGGEYQEVIDGRVDKYHNLRRDQVLLVKDFILEDPSLTPGTSARAVDVPSPVQGYVNEVRKASGFVEILDKKGGEVITRMRHMSDIAVKPGDTVEYGQRIGQQNNLGLDYPPGVGMHAHIEMDTRYYQQYENYIADLVNGRLPVQAEYRKDIQPQPAIDDGVMRLGESGERVFAVQRALVADGYRGAGDKPIEIDGVYRPSLQGAVLAFQQDHRIPRTGDIDPATHQLALRVNLDKPLGPMERQANVPAPELPVLRQMHDAGRGFDPHYTPTPSNRLLDANDFLDPVRTGRPPQYHDHPDHQITPSAPPLLRPQAEAPAQAAAIPQREYRFFSRTPEDDYVEAYLAAAERNDYAARQTLTQQYEQLPHVQAQQQAVREMLEAERRQALEEQLRQEQEQQRLAQQEQEQARSRSHGRSM